jgi:hypothetical protein
MTSISIRGRVPLTWRWAMLPGTIPVAHQEIEAFADLADHLRDQGLVLLTKPTIHIRHGARPTMELSFYARPAGRTERRDLSRVEDVA